MSIPTSDPAASDSNPSAGAEAGRRRLFEERYGPGSLDELLQLFERPCVTYARIAKQFGVTRERVRQWHLSLAPDSPRGHERRRLCQAQQQRRQLLDDPVYRAFVRAARAQFPNASVQPVSSKTGLRKRVVRFGQWLVALKRAGAVRRRHRTRETESYSLTGSRVRVDFYFYHLRDDAFLLVPASLVPDTGTTFLDSTLSKYRRFKNVFLLSGADANAAAIDKAVRGRTRSADPSGKSKTARNQLLTAHGGEWCHCGKA